MEFFQLPKLVKGMKKLFIPYFNPGKFPIPGTSDFSTKNLYFTPTLPLLYPLFTPYLPPFFRIHTLHSHARKHFA